MGAEEPKRTASWVRVKLAAPIDPHTPAAKVPTEGELVLRADRVSVSEDSLIFLCAEEEVFRLDRRYVRTLTWFVDRPTFGEWLRSRRAQYPNSHKRWTDVELATLGEEVMAGVGWEQIALAHGRNVAAVRRVAARTGMEASR